MVYQLKLALCPGDLIALTRVSLESTLVFLPQRHGSTRWFVISPRSHRHAVAAADQIQLCRLLPLHPVHPPGLRQRSLFQQPRRLLLLVTGRYQFALTLSSMSTPRRRVGPSYKEKLLSSRVLMMQRSAVAYPTVSCSSLELITYSKFMIQKEMAFAVNMGMGTSTSTLKLEEQMCS